MRLQTCVKGSSPKSVGTKSPVVQYIIGSELRNQLGVIRQLMETTQRLEFTNGTLEATLEMISRLRESLDEMETQIRSVKDEQS